MNIGYTINIGNYENIKIQSSECKNISECHAELLEILDKYKTIFPNTNTYIKIIKKIEQME